MARRLETKIDDLDHKDRVELKLTDDRTGLLQRVLRKLIGISGFRSITRNVDVAVELGGEYLDRMRDVKNGRLQEIEREIEELEEERRAIKRRWETEDVKFSDL